MYKNVILSSLAISIGLYLINIDIVTVIPGYWLLLNLLGGVARLLPLLVLAMVLSKYQESKSLIYILYAMILFIVIDTGLRSQPYFTLGQPQIMMSSVSILNFLMIALLFQVKNEDIKEDFRLIAFAFLARTLLWIVIPYIFSRQGIIDYMPYAEIINILPQVLILIAVVNMEKREERVE